jgi:hypothetical protein
MRIVTAKAHVLLYLQFLCVFYSLNSLTSAQSGVLWDLFCISCCNAIYPSIIINTLLNTLGIILFFIFIIIKINIWKFRQVIKMITKTFLLTISESQFQITLNYISVFVQCLCPMMETVSYHTLFFLLVKSQFCWSWIHIQLETPFLSFHYKGTWTHMSTHI